MALIVAFYKLIIANQSRFAKAGEERAPSATDKDPVVFKFRERQMV